VTWIINKCLSFLTPVTHKALFRYSAQTVCIHFRHCEHRTQSSPLYSSVNKPAHYRYSASTSSSLSFPHPSSSSDPEETPSLLYGEIGSFISLLPDFTTGLIDLIFPPKGILCCSLPSVAHCVSRKRTRDMFVSCLHH